MMDERLTLFPTDKKMDTEVTLLGVAVELYLKLPGYLMVESLGDMTQIKEEAQGKEQIQADLGVAEGKE